MEGTETAVRKPQGAIPREGEDIQPVERVMDTARKASHADEIVKQSLELDRIRRESAQSNAKFKQRIGDVESVIKTLMGEVARGHYVMAARTIEIPNAEKGVIEIHNLDLPADHIERVIHERPMNLFEAHENNESADASQALADAADGLREEAEEKPKGKKRGRPAKEQPAESEEPAVIETVSEDDTDGDNDDHPAGAARAKKSRKMGKSANGVHAGAIVAPEVKYPQDFEV